MASASIEGTGAWPRRGLLVAAIAWLALAVWGFQDLVDLHERGVLDGSFEDARRSLLALGACWLTVMALCFARSRNVLRALLVLVARGLAGGGLVVAALGLWAVYGAFTRAGGRGPALFGFLLLAALPEGLVLIALWKAGVPALSRARSWAIVTLVALLALGTFAIHLPLIGVRECFLMESTAIAEMRAILSGEDVYQTANRGAFGPPECLVKPTDCLPGYGTEAPPFLSRFVPVRCGYRFTFHSGAPATASGTEGPLARGSVRSFVVTAAPVRVGRTGGRTFCADDSFAIRFSSDARLSSDLRGGCPREWPYLP